MDLQRRIEAQENGTFQPGYVKNKRTGTFHTVPSGAGRTSCGWEHARTTKFTLHAVVPKSVTHAGLCPRGLPKLRLQLLAKETECSREEEADSD